MSFLGIDTSNYTTSIAVSDGEVVSSLKKLLDVREGERGLRQSDAVFQHTVNIPLLFEQLGSIAAEAVGVSSAPRNIQGSYMPCFLVGLGVARTIAALAGVPLYTFSHQEGHIAAALYSAGREDLHVKEFYAFHLSGGTTELLHVNGDEIGIFGKTLDISVGQLIDRTGVKLGMKFPCGREIQAVCGDFDGVTPQQIILKGNDCNLSGIENKIDGMIKKGADREMICRFVMSCVCVAVEKMTERALESKALPILYIGGVSSNIHIRKKLETEFGGLFASPEYSSDNAAGIARLAELRHKRII